MDLEQKAIERIRLASDLSLKHYNKPLVEENKAHARELGEMLKNGMVFQMPEDSEVKV